MENDILTWLENDEVLDDLAFSRPNDSPWNEHILRLFCEVRHNNEGFDFPVDWEFLAEKVERDLTFSGRVL